MNLTRILCLTLCLCVFVVHSTLGEQAAILPGEFTLTGPFSRQQLLLETIRDKQLTGQITNAVVFTSSDPKILRIDGDVALPVTNGTATVTAKAGGLSASAQVKIGRAHV